MVGPIWSEWTRNRLVETSTATRCLIVESTALYVLASMRGVLVDEVRTDDVSMFRIAPECLPMVTRAAVNCVLL